MTTLSHRERVVKALSHEEPDRVPMDFGCIVSSINTRAYANLVKHLGLEEELQDLTKSFTNLTPGPAIMERFEVATPRHGET